MLASSSRICADICVRSWTTLPEPEVPVSAPELRSSSASRAKRSSARWMSGSYAVPSTDPQDVEEALEAAERELSRLSDTPTKQTRH